MKVNQMFPKKYATGEDLQKPVTLQISHVAIEKMTPQAGQPPVEKFVLYFTRATKGVILSRTLAEQIAAATGAEDTEAWKDKKIELYPQPMTVAGKARIAIRARKAPNGESETLPATLQDPDED